MLNVALLSALSYFVCYGGNWIFGQSMSDRPIVIGAFTGLLLNDVYQGLIIGAALEAVFMGSVNIGGQISADHSAATVFAVAFATKFSIGSKRGFGHCYADWYFDGLCYDGCE